MSTSYAIIGAGLAGLTAAREIHTLDPDAHIDVFEATDRIGGKLHTVAFDAGPTDMGAEAYLAFRADATEFFTELGLADRIVHPGPHTSMIYSGGRLHPLPHDTVMGIPSASASLGDLVGEDTRARIDAEGDAPGIDWTVGADTSVGRLVRERFGDDVVDHVVSALLGGVYSCPADDLGLRATVPQLAAELDALAEAGERVTLSRALKNLDEKKQARKTLTPKEKLTPEKTPVFGAFRGGYAELYEELAEQSGADIHLDTFVSGIVAEGGRHRITGAGDTAYDRVLITVPAPTAAVLLRDVAPDAANAAREVKLSSSVVVGMRFDCGDGLPDHSGILIAADEPDMHAKAFTFSSKKWPHIGERGGAFVRASFGTFGDDSMLKIEEDELVDHALDDLQAITGFDGRAAGLSEIYTRYWWGGLPRYSDTHLDTVAAVRAALGGTPAVDVAGAWVDGVGVPAVISGARAAARRLVEGN
ncbi:protoporphyrinogen oxidase [Corynebacterium sp. P6129]|uniref:protoporphyrinogen oxidase n=1 Tax=Corynebacterium antarcticum TaxID=2800405 RepID=UPI002260B102|nr:protoporphyrinogen oxidase [Corynebacterium antarcticum]MCX7491914.1 protoporphyrinogen oxidase [Corynebacterium antarcticum]